MGVKTRTISTFNGATQAAGAATSLIVDTNNRRIKINKLEGYCFGTGPTDNTQYFLQIFASATVPVNGTEPLRSLQVTGQDGFTFDYPADDPLDVSQLAEPPGTGNCIIVLSTTETTLTIATGNIKFDLECDIEDYETQPINTTTVGDQTSNVKQLQIWAEAASPTPSALLQIIAINNSVSDRFLMLFAKDTPSNGDAPLEQWTLKASSTLILNFGDASAGLVPQEMDASAAGTVRRGCSIFISTTTGVLTLVGITTFHLQATYRLQP